MSKRDTYHNIVKQAFIQEGWTTTHDPYSFDADPQRSTDLGAERVIAAEKQATKIAVEIKSFLHESQVGELEKAAGQYRLYLRLLAIQEPERTMVLAVPIHACEDIFRRQVGHLPKPHWRLSWSNRAFQKRRLDLAFFRQRPNNMRNIPRNVE